MVIGTYDRGCEEMAIGAGMFLGGLDFARMFNNIDLPAMVKLVDAYDTE
jgi:hypothetical protein